MKSLLSRSTTVIAVASLVGALATSTVNAHSVLKDTSPRSGERVTTPVTVIRMTFNETISAPRIVTRDSRQRRVAGSLSSTGSIIEFRPTTPLTGGNVTVTWQVRSRDGHAITGKWSFTVSAATQSSPARSGTTSTTPKRTP